MQPRSWDLSGEQEIQNENFRKAQGDAQDIPIQDLDEGFKLNKYCNNL